eukprot:gene11696-12915_t
MKEVLKKFYHQEKESGINHASCDTTQRNWKEPAKEYEKVVLLVKNQKQGESL